MKDLVIQERIKNRIQISDNGCWMWQGAKNQDGYGLMARYKNTISAHRIAFIVFKGEHPRDKYVLHTCDQPACVNPDHLFLGTQLDNMNDMKNKGRSPDCSCENNSKNKLSRNQVDEIRKLYFSGGYTQKELGEMYGVYQSTISYIVRGTKWKGYLCHA